MLSREDLLQMVRDAQEACFSESMHCPWCSGHIGNGDHWHEGSCLWLKVASELRISRSWNVIIMFG